MVLLLSSQGGGEESGFRVKPALSLVSVLSRGFASSVSASVSPFVTRASSAQLTGGLSERTHGKHLA